MHDDALVIVRTMSSPIANAVACAWMFSVPETLFAVPSRAVVLTLNVKVAVPDADFVVVTVIVPAKAQFWTSVSVLLVG